MPAQTLQDLIMRILEEDERARDDDTWLLWRVWREYTRVYIPFEDFKRLPKAESVSRIRRHIQHNLGLYLGRKEMERQAKALESRRFWAGVVQE